MRTFYLLLRKQPCGISPPQDRKIIPKSGALRLEGVPHALPDLIFTREVLPGSCTRKAPRLRKPWLRPAHESRLAWAGPPRFMPMTIRHPPHPLTPVMREPLTPLPQTPNPFVSNPSPLCHKPLCNLQLGSARQRLKSPPAPFPSRFPCQRKVVSSPSVVANLQKTRQFRKKRNRPQKRFSGFDTPSKCVSPNIIRGLVKSAAQKTGEVQFQIERMIAHPAEWVKVQGLAKTVGCHF